MDAHFDEFFLATGYNEALDNVPYPHPFGWRVVWCAVSGTILGLFYYKGRRLGEARQFMPFPDGTSLRVGDNLRQWLKESEKTMGAA